MRLRKSGRSQELVDGTLFSKLLLKLGDCMITQYSPWCTCYENQKNTNIESLLEWVNLEAEFAVHASEVTQGINAASTVLGKQKRNDVQAGRHTFFSAGNAHGLPKVILVSKASTVHVVKKFESALVVSTRDMGCGTARRSKKKV